VHARGRLLRNAAKIFGHSRPPLGILLQLAAEKLEDHLVLVRVVLRIEVGDAACLLELHSLVNE
jgi:hypothetical protein